MSRGSDAWGRYQHAEIRRCLNQLKGASSLKAVPLYPGSMLFNQIAIINHPHTTDLAHYRPHLESLDSVYEAIGITVDAVADEPVVLIDCQNWSSSLEQELLLDLNALVEHHGERCRAVVVDSPHTGPIKQMCSRVALPYQIIKPRWWQASQWLYWYRSAASCIFVDSARVLDAAMTGAACRLLTTQSYTSSPVYPALHMVLSGYAHCRSSSTVVSEIIPHLAVVENDREQFRVAMGSDYVGATADAAVISAEGIWQHTWRNKLGNLQISTRRKSRKLFEDPRAFFKDSKLPGSDGVAAVFRQSSDRVSNS